MGSDTCTQPLCQFMKGAGHRATSVAGHGLLCSIIATCLGVPVEAPKRSFVHTYIEVQEISHSSDTR